MSSPKVAKIAKTVLALALALQVGCASASTPAPAIAAPAEPSSERAENQAEIPGDRGDPEAPAKVPFETGIASFYHPSLAGNETANGERYDPKALTCAHPSLKFGTAVEVKLVRTGASAVCRVNDRGPFAKGRVIDLSQGMADALGVAGDDIHKVELYKAE